MADKPKITNRELNQRLLEAMGAKDLTPETKKAMEEVLSEKFNEIRKEVRQEVFEEMKKQHNIDKEQLIESVDTITKKVVQDQMKKFDAHNKSLIKAKLDLNESKANLDKELKDREETIKNSYKKLLKEQVEKIQKKFNSDKDTFTAKATQFINETVKKELGRTRDQQANVANHIELFDKFITEQVKGMVRNHRNELKALDALKVQLVQENARKLAEEKKKFMMESADKISAFVTSGWKKELKEFRKDIAENRKKAFGMKLFEAFCREFNVKFFNEDKVVKGMMESLKTNSSKLVHKTNLLEEKNKKIQEENKKLAMINESLTREKIIREATAHLPTSKKEMVFSLAKTVPTDRLAEQVSKYAKMIMTENLQTLVNKNKENEKLLKEGKSLKVVTGDNKSKNTDITKFMNSDSLKEEEMNDVIKMFN